MFASFDWQKSISIWFDFEGCVASIKRNLKHLLEKSRASADFRRKEFIRILLCPNHVGVPLWKGGPFHKLWFTYNHTFLWGTSFHPSFEEQLNWISVSVIIYYKLSLGNDQRIKLRKVNCTFYLLPVFGFTYKGLSTLLNFEEDFQFLQEPASVSLVSHWCHLMA